jgi:hypothetical protein
MTVFFLLLISSVAVILAQTAHIQPIQAKRNCEFEEDGGLICSGGEGGRDTRPGGEIDSGGQGGRTEFDDASRDESVEQGGGGGRETETESHEEPEQGGGGGRQVCTVDPDTDTRVCEGVGSRYN